MIIKLPITSINSESNRFQQEFLHIAGLVNFYSTFIIMVIGILLNLTIIYILNSKRRARQKSFSRLSHRNRLGVPSKSLSSSELYMSALAVVDTLFLISYLLPNKGPLFVSTSDIFQIVHGSRIACKLTNFLRYTSRFCSSYFVVFFAYERFMAVRRPLERIKSSKSRTLTKIFIFGVTLISIVINSYSPLMFELEADESASVSTNTNRFTCAINSEKFLRKLHSPFQFIISFIIPILLVCFFNISNICALLTRKKEIKIALASTMSTASTTMSRDNITTPLTGLAGTVVENSVDSTRIIGGSTNQISASLRGGNSVRRRGSIRLRDSNRATNILIVVSLCFVGLNLPFVISRALVILQESPISVAVLLLAEILHVVNFAIDFLLYCLASKQFRNEIIARLARFKPSKTKTLK